MTVETFFANFGHLAGAPNGVQKLRELILQLAAQGKLVSQAKNDEPASVLLERIDAQRKLLLKEGKVRKPKQYESVEEKEQFCLVPENWCWARMGELILDITGGGTPSKNNPSYWGGDIPWASVKDVGKSKYLDSTIDSITPKGLQCSSSNLIPKGRVIICTRMGLGKISINRIDVAINQDLKALWLPECLEMDYFYNFFLTQDVKGTGMTVAGIRQDALLNMPVPLPPLEEQKRIVAKVDQLMALCDELEARQQKQQQGRVRLNNSALDALLTAREPDDFAVHWQRISTNFDLLYDHPETIAKLRAAILQLAVQGKLLGGQSKSIRSGTKVKDFVSLQNGYAFKSSWFSNEGVRLVRNKNISHGHLDWTESAMLSVKQAGEYERFNLSEGDIVLSLDRPIITTGLKVARISEDDLPSLLLQRVGRFQFKNNELLPDYLYVWLKSPCFIETIDPGRSNGVPHISSKEVENIPFEVFSIEEQKRIVAKVQQLMALCDELEASLNQAQQHSKKLMEATVRQLLVA